MRYLAANDVFKALQAKFAGNAFVVLPQVANATGFGANRWCDAVVVSLWPSRGLWLHGFEIKVTRGDWLRELRKGDKAESHYQVLDYYSVLTAGPGIVEPDEVPEPWGHYEQTRKGIKVVKPAMRRSTDDAPLDRAFVLGLLRSFDKTVVAADVQQRLEEQYQRGVEVGQRQAERALDHQRTHADKNAAFYAAFNEAHQFSDFELSLETAARLGRIVRALRSADAYATGFNDVIHRLESATAAVRELDALMPNEDRRRNPRSVR